MKSNLLNLIRGDWALLPTWVGANAQILDRYLKGEAEALEGEEASRDPEPILMYSPLYRVSPYTQLDKLPEGSTAFVDVVGVITKYGGWCSYGAQHWADLTDRLSNATNIKNIIYNIDSPGGQVFGTQLFADAIKRSPKRTIAFISDGYAASAAMWVASACDEIYCSHATDEVGSIGVYCVLHDFNTYLKNEGLPVIEVYAPQSSEKNIEARSAFGGNVKPLEGHLAVLADAFIQTISDNRASKLKGDAWKRGAMFFAPDALKLGLIDGIKNLAQITDMLDSDDTALETDDVDPLLEEEDEDTEDFEGPQSETQNPDDIMFGKKYKALGALENVAAESISDDAVAAANAELASNGIYSGLQLMNAEAVEADRTELAALRTENAEMKKQPGGYFRKADVSEAEDRSDDADDSDSIIASLPHNQKADSLYK